MFLYYKTMDCNWLTEIDEIFVKTKCPVIYGNYLKLINGEKKNPLVSVKTKGELALLTFVFSFCK